jgi:hypothetical protein
MTRLFELAHEFRALSELESSDDLPPEVIADTLEGLQGEFEIKAEQVAKFILSLEASAQQIKEASEAMAKRASRLQRRADSVRQYLLLQLMFVDFKKIETSELVIRRQKNPGALTVTDESVVPEMYWIQPEPPPKRIDKDAVKKAIGNGVKVEGCYVESSERIEIRL